MQWRGWKVAALLVKWLNFSSGIRPSRLVKWLNDGSSGIGHCGCNEVAEWLHRHCAQQVPWSVWTVVALSGNTGVVKRLNGSSGIRLWNSWMVAGVPGTAGEVKWLNGCRGRYFTRPLITAVYRFRPSQSENLFSSIDDKYWCRCSIIHIFNQ